VTATSELQIRIVDVVFIVIIFSLLMFQISEFFFYEVDGRMSSPKTYTSRAREREELSESVLQE
jgi:hypothetical protein